MQNLGVDDSRILKASSRKLGYEGTEWIQLRIEQRTIYFKMITGFGVPRNVGKFLTR